MELSVVVKTKDGKAGAPKVGVKAVTTGPKVSILKFRKKSKSY